MFRVPVRDPLQKPIERAVELSRSGTSTQREYAAGSNAPTHEDVTTTADLDGGTVYTAITDLDFTDNPNALTI